ncbi:MAG TPA: nucleotide exchange factor GrpE [Vicinamibacterales bacterium]
MNDVDVRPDGRDDRDDALDPSRADGPDQEPSGSQQAAGDSAAESREQTDDAGSHVQAGADNPGAASEGSAGTPGAGSEETVESGGADGRGANDPAVDFAPLLQERDALRDRLLRTAAEFDNFRKRVERERREMVERAAEDVLRDLLPIIDNLERALATSAGPEAVEAYRQGVELIHRQLLDLLAQRGVTPIDALGADFDPHLHEAVASAPADGHRDGEIIEVFRTGYRMGDRLLRAAMVKVAKA